MPVVVLQVETAVTRNGIQQRYRYQRDQAEHEVDAVMCDF